eukprot:5714029-Pleurochrysis_carterae.AAC.2
MSLSSRPLASSLACSSICLACASAAAASARDAQPLAPTDEGFSDDAPPPASVAGGSAADGAFAQRAAVPGQWAAQWPPP